MYVKQSFDHEPSGSKLDEARTRKGGPAKFLVAFFLNESLFGLRRHELNGTGELVAEYNTKLLNQRVHETKG